MPEVGIRVNTVHRKWYRAAWYRALKHKMAPYRLVQVVATLNGTMQLGTGC